MATTDFLNSLLVASALAAVLWLLAYTVRFVARDGYGMFSAHHRPPRSHHSEEIGARPAH